MSDRDLDMLASASAAQPLSGAPVDASRKCHFCGAEGDWPLICMNTRDMEDNAIYGWNGEERSERCYRTLIAGDLGEKGARYVTLNRERRLSGAPDDAGQSQGRVDVSRRVIIDYSDWRGKRSLRCITPLSIEWAANERHPEPGWLLTAHDHGKSAIRIFALAGIHSWGYHQSLHPHDQARLDQWSYQQTTDAAGAYRPTSSAPKPGASTALATHPIDAPPSAAEIKEIVRGLRSRDRCDPRSCASFDGPDATGEPCICDAVEKAADILSRLQCAAESNTPDTELADEAARDRRIRELEAALEKLRQRS